MVTFNFDGPTSSLATNVSGPATLTYTEAGVNFTLSIINGDGSNAASISEFGFSDVFLANSFTAGETFVLDVTGPGQTQFDDTITFFVSAFNGTWSVNGQSVVTGTNMLTGPQSDLTFTSSTASSTLTIDSLTATVNCYCPGTLIATSAGERAVETLEAGDMVLTADGRATPVTWLGRQTVDAALTHPAKINPIRIMAGALGDGLPKQDLRLSPDHAIAIDGVLYNAGALVNGVTIYQERGKLPDGFAYYHIETGAHELLLAEGVPAESFVDYAGRDAFNNGDEVHGPIAEMDLPRISAARQVPAHLRERLTPKWAAE